MGLNMDTASFDNDLPEGSEKQCKTSESDDDEPCDNLNEFGACIGNCKSGWVKDADMKCVLDTDNDVDEKEEDDDVDPQPEVIEWSLCEEQPASGSCWACAADRIEFT